MKLTKPIQVFLILTLGISVLYCHELKSLAWAADPVVQSSVVERDFLVQGMTCGGCVFGVKKALRRVGLDPSQIVDVDYRKPDPANQVGHAKVRFSKEEYKGKETDCKIIKAIRDNPGYLAYLDPTNPDPCRLSKSKN